MARGIAWAQRGNPGNPNPRDLSALPLIGKPGTVPGVAGFSPNGTPLEGEGLSKWLNRSAPDEFAKSPVAKKHSEIKCSVLDWEAQLPSPTLFLVCPPKLVFAPLYVYFRLTWASPGDVPKDLETIVASPKSQTKVEPLRTAMRVWLQTNTQGGGHTDGKWIEFNRVSISRLEAE